MFSSLYLIWAGMWGILYRKFFWDFIGGVRMDTLLHKGIVPGKNVSPFLAVIVTRPLIQVFAIVLGSINLMLEFPGPFVKRTRLYRSLIFRTVLLIVQAFLGVLFYQGTNGAISSLVAASAYVKAQTKGERIERSQDEDAGTAG
ncbi:hypothetical protein FRB97_009596 [Tulasnella sp. 331]|nr:hypothetical protein FRB97_009596 [Tulasnella sp. 331]KAG8883619.1 hypothetical protein FRB98_003047 [Tulasnella sp. 332]